MSWYEVMPLLPAAIVMRIGGKATILAQPAKHWLSSSSDRGVPHAFYFVEFLGDCELAAEFAAPRPKIKLSFFQMRQ